MPNSPITAGERFADIGSFSQRGGDGPNLWRTLGFRRTDWAPGSATVEWDATADYGFHTPTGPVILAPNHFSQWDHFFAAVYLQRKVQFMAKSQLFKNPAIKFIFKHGGAFPVRRGHHDEEAFVTSNAVLERGGTLLMYAEGGRSRTGDLGEPKRGIGKIALESGAPVVPVAIHGSAIARRRSGTSGPLDQCLRRCLPRLHL